MDKRDGPVVDISLERGEISHTGMEISPYKHSQAGQPGSRDENSKIPPQAIFNNCQNNKIVNTREIKIVNTREIHPAYQAVSLSGPARLPYKHKSSNRLIYQSIRSFIGSTRVIFGNQTWQEMFMKNTAEFVSKTSLCLSMNIMITDQVHCVNKITGICIFVCSPILQPNNWDLCIYLSCFETHFSTQLCKFKCLTTFTSSTFNDQRKYTGHASKPFIKQSEVKSAVN